MNGTNPVLNFPYFIVFMFPVNLIQEICYLHAIKLVCKLRLHTKYSIFTTYLHIIQSTTVLTEYVYSAYLACQNKILLHY